MRVCSQLNEQLRVGYFTRKAGNLLVNVCIALDGPSINTNGVCLDSI
jgi:hypothetical protein